MFLEKLENYYHSIKSVFRSAAEFCRFLVLQILETLLPEVVLNFMIQRKMIFFAISGSLTENSFLIVLAGRSCANLSQFAGILLFNCLFSFLADLFLYFILRAIKIKKIDQNSLVLKLRTYGKWALLIYRFIPFVRIPIIFLTRVSLKDFIVLNGLGAIFWSCFFTSFGYFTN